MRLATVCRLLNRYYNIVVVSYFLANVLPPQIRHSRKDAEWLCGIENPMEFKFNRSPARVFSSLPYTAPSTHGIFFFNIKYQILRGFRVLSFAQCSRAASVVWISEGRGVRLVRIKEIKLCPPLVITSSNNNNTIAVLRNNSAQISIG